MRNDSIARNPRKQRAWVYCGMVSSLKLPSQTPVGMGKIAISRSRIRSTHNTNTTGWCILRPSLWRLGCPCRTPRFTYNSATRACQFYAARGPCDIDANWAKHTCNGREGGVDEKRVFKRAHGQWYKIRFACGRPWVQIPVCPLLQYFLRSLCGSLTYL